MICIHCNQPIKDEPVRTVIGPVHLKCADYKKGNTK